MIQLTAQMRILVAVEPVDFRRGIDGLCRLCRQALVEVRAMRLGNLLTCPPTTQQRERGIGEQR